MKIIEQIFLKKPSNMTRIILAASVTFWWLGYKAAKWSNLGVVEFSFFDLLFSGIAIYFITLLLKIKSSL